MSNAAATWKVVAVNGSPQKASRTQVVIDALLAKLEPARRLSVQTVALSDLGPALAACARREAVPERVEQHLRAIEQADLLVVGSPVYRASYTGLFKHLFDLVHHEALVGVPVLLAATGGSDRHALMIDHQLRPLFGFFQAQTLPLGVYASEADFNGLHIQSPTLQARIQRAAAVAGQHLARARALAA